MRVGIAHHRNAISVLTQLNHTIWRTHCLVEAELHLFGMNFAVNTALARWLRPEQKRAAVFALLNQAA